MDECGPILSVYYGKRVRQKYFVVDSAQKLDEINNYIIKTPQVG